MASQCINLKKGTNGCMWSVFTMSGMCMCCKNQGGYKPCQLTNANEI